MTSADGGVMNKPHSGQNWTALIDEIVDGSWFNPELNALAKVDIDTIVFETSLDGGEADLVAPLGLGTSVAVVADTATHDALGGRVARNLSSLGSVETIVPRSSSCRSQDSRRASPDSQGL